jgi:hypothetical protein
MAASPMAMRCCVFGNFGIGPAGVSNDGLAGVEHFRERSGCAFGIRETQIHEHVGFILDRHQAFVGDVEFERHLLCETEFRDHPFNFAHIVPVAGMAGDDEVRARLEQRRLGNGLNQRIQTLRAAEMAEGRELAPLLGCGFVPPTRDLVRRRRVLLIARQKQLENRAVEKL